MCPKFILNKRAYISKNRSLNFRGCTVYDFIKIHYRHSEQSEKYNTIGITHVFHALTFAGSRGRCLNMRPLGRVFKRRPRDPASVNAMEQTCLIVILANLT